MTPDAAWMIGFISGVLMTTDDIVQRFLPVVGALILLVGSVLIALGMYSVIVVSDRGDK